MADQPRDLSDARWMAAALALSERGRSRTTPNPNVGCVIVSGGRAIGRGWTQPGGRPHAEAMALAQAGERARGATVYTTLEPCAHFSARGPACADVLSASGVARVVIARGDPDPRTDGRGAARLRAAGVDVVEGMAVMEASLAMAGFLTRRRFGRPHVTLKLATSLDGRIAMPSGESRWITGPEARAHAHLERARHDAILVGRGTYEADAPRLDVRLPGLEARSPWRFLLSSSHPGEGGGRSPKRAGPDEAANPGPGFRGADGREWLILRSPAEIARFENVDHLLVEGGAQTAAAFLREGLVDRLLLYRAPILIGAGRDALGDIGLAGLADAHGRWWRLDTRTLGSDRLEVYAAN